MCVYASVFVGIEVSGRVLYQNQYQDGFAGSNQATTLRIGQEAVAPCRSSNAELKGLQLGLYTTRLRGGSLVVQLLFAVCMGKLLKMTK